MGEAIMGLLLPFAGTSLGAAAVLFVRKGQGRRFGGLLSDAAAGIMAAASVFSLLLPAMEQAADRGLAPWLPAVFGFSVGAGLLGLWDRVSMRIGRAGRVSHSTRMMVLSVCLHNIPEGMAVGAAYAGLLAGSTTVTAMGALALSLGIAVQNLPEGAIVSLPLSAAGVRRGKALLLGVLSGASEPIAGAATILLSRLAVPALPWLLAFAAGAMAYVAAFGLLPETFRERPRSGLFCALGGFALMTAMDVLLG